jgi:hypothetical protein
MSWIFFTSKGKFRKENLKFRLPFQVKYNFHCTSFKKTHNFCNEYVPDSVSIGLHLCGSRAVVTLHPSVQCGCICIDFRLRHDW